MIIDGEEGPKFPRPRTFLQECEIQRHRCKPCMKCGRRPAFYQKSVVHTPIPFLVEPAIVWGKTGPIPLIPRIHVACACYNEENFVFSSPNPITVRQVWNRIRYQSPPLTNYAQCAKLVLRPRAARVKENAMFATVINHSYNGKAYETVAHVGTEAECQAKAVKIFPKNIARVIPATAAHKAKLMGGR